MIASRLVHLIETRSDDLAAGLTDRLQNTESLADLRKVPAAELRQRTYEVYHNLSDWLERRTEQEIERCYMEIGARRAAQGVALSSVIRGLLLVDEHLWEFIRREGLVDHHVELHQELDLLQIVDQFFDRAVYYAARGYEKYQAEHASPEVVRVA